MYELTKVAQKIYVIGHLGPEICLISFWDKAQNEAYSSQSETCHISGPSWPILMIIVTNMADSYEFIWNYDDQKHPYVDIGGENL